MDIAEIKRRYTELLPVPHITGEREWVDRITTFEHFMEFGPMISEHLSNVGEREKDRLREMAPRHYDLLVEAFPLFS